MKPSEQDWIYKRNLFFSALAGSLLLMASGLFLGQLGVDDELNALTTAFDGTGRGLWAQHLITFLLPGQLGISFAPMALGCAIYALSIAMIIHLWGPIRPRIGYISAALIGSFPYFASMMTFDVAQVAYPIGFLLISACMIPIFTSHKPLPVALSVISFAVAFACYQGVAPTFATAWASITGMRYFTAPDKNIYLKRDIPAIAVKSLVTAIIGSLIYLLSIKTFKAIIPHAAWSGDYEMQLVFALNDPQRLQQIGENASALFTGKSGDAPLGASILLLAGIAVVSLRLLLNRDVTLAYRPFVALAFLFSVLVFPFWLIFVQPILLNPRSAVGLGVLYGYLFAALATTANRRVLAVLAGLAALVVISFIFKGNEMYFTQYLANRAEQVTVTRVASRLDAVAQEHHLKAPFEVTFIGRYAPAGRRFARYDTLGSSPLDWDNGNIHRQAALFETYGIDGIQVNRDDAVRKQILDDIRSRQIPAWPDVQSVFLYNNKIVVVYFGER